MGIYLPYEEMPKNRIECPLNYGGLCLIAPKENESNNSDLCIGIMCGRIRPIPNKINGQKVNIKD